MKTTVKKVKAGRSRRSPLAAYAAVQPFAEPNIFVVALCIRGDDGWRPVHDYGQGDKSRIENIVRRLNEGLGVSDVEARQIAISTQKTLSGPLS